MDEIIMINNIMEENKKKLAQLREQLKKSDTRIAALEETIKLLTAKLEAKEMELESLKSDLARLNFTIGSLNATVDTLRGETAEQSRIINQQDALIGEMNTVWYVIGTKKELTDKGIIEKAGGLFSGERKMMEQINPAHFTTADMRETKKIAFESAKVELATVHPEGTYMFIQENDLFSGIEIIDPVEFWKSSRFLVVIIK
jgi:septal ring factor EnvC (AmiA/AmiB activator)